jgi:predicted transcriptional regulator
MTVTSCMKRNVISVHSKTTIREAANIFVKKHIGLLPVVDDNDKPVGVIGMHDMLTLQLLDFVNFLAL